MQTARMGIIRILSPCCQLCKEALEEWNNFVNELKEPAESWIISGWKRQGQMKQEVRNVGKFSASTFSIQRQLSVLPTFSISIMRLINSELLRHLN